VLEQLQAARQHCAERQVRRIGFLSHELPNPMNLEGESQDGAASEWDDASCQNIDAP